MGLWQLPINTDKTFQKNQIHHRAKYHYFEDCESLCGKYQQLDYYPNSHDGDKGFAEYEGVMTEAPHLACKVCYARWKKQYNIGI